jgi:hypothetical protein
MRDRSAANGKKGIAMKSMTWGWLVMVTLAATVPVTGCDRILGDEASKDDDGSSKKKKKEKKVAEDDEHDDGESEKKSNKLASTAAATGAPAPPAPTVATPTPPAAPVTEPTQQTYPDIANPIPANCSNAWAIAGNAPTSVGDTYAWPWARQAMLANQQFRIVGSAPTSPGEVMFELHQASDRFNNAWVLLARCADGTTCNKLTAMIKGTINGAPAQVGCGPLPMDLGTASFRKPLLRDLANPQGSLPASDDVIGQCARLQACSVATDPPSKAGKEKIGFDCQKAPSRVKRDCATRYPCAEVMKCLAGG